MLIRVDKGRPSRVSQLSRIVGVAISASLLAVACGGGGLSKEEFIAQADEICATAQEQAEEIPQPTDPGSAEAFAASLEEVTTGYVAELRELEPPEEDAEAIAGLIDQIEQAGLKIVEATRRGSTGGNPAELYSEALHLAEDANEAAQAYGFESCGVSQVLSHD